MSKTKLKIGHFPIVDHLILGISKHNDGGHFKHFELETKLQSNWETLTDDVSSGKLDGGFFLFPIALDMYRKDPSTNLILLGHREGQQLVSHKEITTIEQLSGKTVHVPHKYSTHHILLHQALKQAGVNPEDVTIRMGFKSHPKEVADAFIAGETDALLLAEPMSTYARHNVDNNILALSHDINAHHVDCVLVLRDEVIEKYPEAVQELTDSLVKAGMFINSYPRQAAEIGADFLGWDKKLLLESLTHDRGHILFWDLLPRVEDMEEMQRIAVEEMHLWDKEIDLSDFVDSSFAQEAYREWMLDTRRAIKDRGQNRTLPGNAREALYRSMKLLSDEISAVGVKYIESGEKLPKAVSRVKDIPGTLDRFLAEATRNPIVLETNGTKKAVGFLTIDTDNEFDRIILEVSKDDAILITKVVGWGVSNTETRSYDDPSAWKHLVTSTEPVTSMNREKDDSLWLSIDEEVFRFLPLALAHFK